MLSEPTSTPPPRPCMEVHTREHLSGRGVRCLTLQQTRRLSDQPLESEGRPGRQETDSACSRLQGPFPTWLGASCPIPMSTGVNWGTPGPGRLLGHRLQRLGVSVISPTAGRQGCGGLLTFLDP